MTSPSPSQSTPTATATSTATALATKTRIISHMNASHADSLTLFLQHFCSMPPSQISSPRLLDITPSQLVIAPAGSAHNVIIPLKPPMESLAGARTRMVEMHAAALAGLDLSGTRVDRWAPPARLWQWALSALATVSFVSFPFASWVTPQVGGWLYWGWSLGGMVPGLAWLVNKLGFYALAFMVVAHGLEMGVMATGRLRRHRVESGSWVWWAWVGNVFVSGVAALDRFDGLVAEMEEMENAKRSEKGGGGH